MPTYEYRCPQGHVFEKFSPTMTDKRSAACPTCGKRARRLISGGAGLVFKGSGFYITDYKRAGERSASGGAAKPDGSATPAEGEKGKNQPAEGEKSKNQPAEGEKGKNQPAEGEKGKKKKNDAGSGDT